MKYLEINYPLCLWAVAVTMLLLHGVGIVELRHVDDVAILSGILIFPAIAWEAAMEEYKWGRYRK